MQQLIYIQLIHGHEKPFARKSVGNTIQNTNTKNLNGTFNMMTLYNKIPYFRRVNTGGK